MKTKIFTTLTALATAATALLSLSTSAQAYSFGTQGVEFDQDTIFNFAFFDSHGKYQSTLGIYTVDSSNTTSLVKTLFKEVKGSDEPSGANEWQGSFGDAVAGGDATFDQSGKVSDYGSQTQEFTFKANQLYTFGLTSLLNGRNAGTVFSSDKTQHAVFGEQDTLLNVLNLNSTRSFPNPENYTSGDPFTSTVLLAFDDGGNHNDTDFQDFIVTAEATLSPNRFGSSAIKAVPEPASLAGLGLMAGSIVFSRRRRRQIGSTI